MFLNPMPYDKMASATSYSFGISQHHINILVWYYHQCLQVQWNFLIPSIMNITSVQWNICTILLLFCREAYNHRFKVLCHGVTIKVSHGIIPSVL